MVLVYGYWWGRSNSSALKICFNLEFDGKVGRVVSFLGAVISAIADDISTLVASKLVPFLKIKFGSYIRIVTWNLIHLFILFYYWQYKIQLTIGESCINNEDSLLIAITTDRTVNSFVKGYHVNKDLWKPLKNERLTTVMEKDKFVDKCAVCVKKNDVMTFTSW